jgi:7,8-dihydropterin-6-yl-methyl-4-(beta-D-ribofuranosyl)aminobenzene 5'-phosphate synthase
MYVKVLYDEFAKKGLLSGHGFSCLIGDKILFDTGESSNSLLENMNRMMVFPEDIEGVVISHDHWDHTGGLWELLKKNNKITVHACRSFSNTFKNCVTEAGSRINYIAGVTEIYKNIFTTGGISTRYKGGVLYEQSLVVKGDKGLSIITGCGHPGTGKIIGMVKDHFKTERIYMVLGGFPLFDKSRDKLMSVIEEFRNLGVEKVGAAHCSGEKFRRMLRGSFFENYVPVKGGHIIHL